MTINLIYLSMTKIADTQEILDYASLTDLFSPSTDGAIYMCIYIYGYTKDIC